ncbi:MAG TPA: isoprenylcysteine carboxylmethyltransferase family protein [Pyrinomonadaceae bacterium]|nr:isoprenylcysteine carboxylmethyltransferase family protein [Pyrinomonadaceae bacterium]
MSTMSHNETFRAILIVGSLILFPIAVYHRFKSQATGEKLNRRQEGLFILFTLRPVGILSMLGLIAYMVNPSWMAWSAVTLPDWLRWIGVGVGAAAGGLLIWTLHSLGKNLTDTVVTRREHTLVATGPYRWVRHPFYDSVALCVLANSLVASNWFLFLTGGLALVLIFVRTRTEEEKLLARFGDDYRAYRKRTGRFLPRVGT